MKILSYSDEISVAAGETIRFMVSCEGTKSYRADIVRVICGDENPEGPGFKERLVRTAANGTYQARRQSLAAGSYAIVPAHPALDRLTSFTVQAMIWPTTPAKGEQTVIAKWNERSQSGFQLMIDAKGASALKLGDGAGKTDVITVGAPMLERAWYFIGASFDAKTARASVYQEPLVHHAKAATNARASRKTKLARVDTGHAPLTMAAYVRRSRKGRNLTASHYNGKIDGPKLMHRALGRADMARVQRDPAPSHLKPTVVGAWDFSLDIPSQRISDTSGNGLHGETVNLPARAMTGHNWSGRDMRFSAAAHEYGAIHFHDDDLYDAGWEPDFELTVPKTMTSGCYAARLRAGEAEDYIPFFVRPRRGRPTAKILYLAQTATYMAYANLSFVAASQYIELMAGRLVVVQPSELHLEAHPELGLSLYDLHSDMSGVCYSSRLRPVLNMQPKAMYSPGAAGSSLWGYNADTHLTDWLEAKGFAFEVATDEDLHEDGVALLEPYRVVVTGTHPEYVSTAMRDALEAYTQRGGRLLYMGGNGFYWRIAYNPSAPGVIEVRRARGGTGAWIAEPGESYHSFSDEPGGLWRFQNRGPHRLVGSGFVAQGFDTSTYYRRAAASLDPRVAFAFKGIGTEERIGDFGLLGGGAAGIEVDSAESALGTPPHALVVASSENLTDNYLLAHEHMVFATPVQIATANPAIRADLVFFETANGGAVFGVGSMAWCGSLSHNDYDNNVSRITGNVLTRFASKKPF